MKNPFTRETISEAVAFGTGVLPRFTLVELAQVLGVSLRDLLRCVQANRSRFVFDSDKNVIAIKSNHEASILVDGLAAWQWFVTNVCGGNEKVAMPLQNQSELMRNTQRPIRWEQQFTYVFAPHITDQSNGEGLNAKMTAIEPALAGRMTRLGLINGTGNTPDKYFFGIIPTESEIKNKRSGKLHLYLAEAVVEMMQSDSWVMIEPEKEWVRSETRYPVEAQVPVQIPVAPNPVPTLPDKPTLIQPKTPPVSNPVPDVKAVAAVASGAVRVPGGLVATPSPVGESGLNTIDQLSALLQPVPADVKAIKQDIRKQAGSPEPVTAPPSPPPAAVAVAPRAAVPVVPAAPPAQPKSAVEASDLLNDLLGRVGG